MKINSEINISFKLKILEHTRLWEKSNFMLRLLLVLFCLTVVFSKGAYNYYILSGLALYIGLILWLGIRLNTKSKWTVLDVVIPTFIDIATSLLLILGSKNGTIPFTLAYLIILLTLTRLPIKQSFYLTFAYILFLTSYFLLYEKNTDNIFASLLMLLALLVIQKFIRTKEALEVAAHTDALTGTFNRRYFNKYIHLLASSNLVMMMVDINNLKQINDNFGHDCGDQVIKVVADTLKSYCNNNGITIRWGGDEFLVILCHAKEPERITDQINNDISRNFILTNDTKIPISVSIGITKKVKSESFIDTVNRVDKKMYQEKNKIHRKRNYVITLSHEN